MLIADHFDRRKVLIATNLLRAATVAALVLVDRPDRIWLLYVLTALQFVFSAIFTPAETALIPSVVEEDDLITANALDSLDLEHDACLRRHAGRPGGCVLRRHRRFPAGTR